MTISSLAQAKPPREPAPTWFKEVGLSLHGGVLLNEPSTSEGVDTSGAMGGSVAWGWLRVGPHRALIQASYTGIFGENRDGSREFEVVSTTQFLDFLAGYDFTWRWLVMGGKIGLGLPIVHTQATLYEVTHVVEDGDTIVIDRVGTQDEWESTGTRPCFVGGLDAGVELGRLFGKPGALEVRAEGRAMLRGQEQDFLVGLAIWLWPTALKAARP